LPEQTLIGVASALHVQRPVVKHDTGDGKTYATLASPVKPSIIKGSLELEVPKTKISKRKK